MLLKAIVFSKSTKFFHEAMHEMYSQAFKAFDSVTPGLLGKKACSALQKQGSVRFTNPNCESEPNWLQIRVNQIPFHQSVHQIQAKNETNSEGRRGESKLGFGFAVRIDKSNTAHLSVLTTHVVVSQRCARETLRQFCLFDVADASDLEDEGETLCCRGCEQDKDECKCQRVIEAFHNLNKQL